MFTKRPATKNHAELKPDDVITYLTKHHQALLLYLEHLVLERQIQVSDSEKLLVTRPIVILFLQGYHTQSYAYKEND